MQKQSVPFLCTGCIKRKFKEVTNNRIYQTNFVRAQSGLTAMVEESHEENQRGRSKAGKARQRKREWKGENWRKSKLEIPTDEINTNEAGK